MKYYFNHSYILQDAKKKKYIRKKNVFLYAIWNILNTVLYIVKFLNIHIMLQSTLAITNFHGTTILLRVTYSSS
jgi:hypothetical protein